MNKNQIFLAANGKTITRAEWLDNTWQVQNTLEGMKVNTLLSDPIKPEKVYAGTQRDGILVSNDTGKSWQQIGMKNIPVKSLAISPRDPEVIYAGCKPVSLFVSQNGGESWEEYEGLRKARRWWWFSPAEPPDWRPYVIALTISPANPNVIMAGIELGGVLRSNDGGRTWSNHRRGAERDCHSLKFHTTNGKWVYQGGGGGPALSQDGGLSWRKLKNGIGTKYGWMAHKDGQANAHIYRSVGGAQWEQLSGGLPETLDYMAYALITDAKAPGFLYAGLANGEIWKTENYGDSWERLPFSMGGIHNTMILI